MYSAVWQSKHQKSVSEKSQEPQVEAWPGSWTGTWEQEAIIHSLKAEKLSSMLYIPYDQDKDSELVAELQRELSWFDSPLSIQPGTHPATGSSILKIQMKSTETAIAVYVRLKTRYPGLKIDIKDYKSDTGGQ